MKLKSLRASRWNLSCIGLTPRKLLEVRKLWTVQVVERVEYLDLVETRREENNYVELGLYSDKSRLALGTSS